MDSNPPIAILGAGISGLSAAYALKKQGCEVTLYEKKDRVGGVIQTYTNDGWQVENGPNTMLVRDQKIWDLLDDLNLTDHILLPGDKAKKRYIIRDGSLCPAPMGLMDFLKTNLLSTKAKWRLLKEPFVKPTPKDDESIACFMRRRLGDEPLDYTVNPFVSGVYAGDPEQLSIRHTFSSLFEMEQQYGSLTKGFLKRDKKGPEANRKLISLDEGLQLLPQKLHAYLGDAVQLNHTVSSVSKAKTGWDIALQSGAQKVEKFHQIIISTLPVYQLPNIWNDDKSGQSSKLLSGIDYAPMSVLALGFKRDQVQHLLDGFGMLIPEIEPFSMLGCLFSSSLFPNRAPQNHVLLTCFVGGTCHPQLAAQSTGTLVDEVMPQLQKLLGVQSAPTFQHHTFWRHAIPQYNVGYDAFLSAMKNVETENPGFFLTGNYRNGVSVPDCILNGFKTAEQVEKMM